MTGSVGKDGFRRGMNCGADDYLQKPFQPEELIEAVVSRLVRHAEMQASLLQRAERMHADDSSRPSSEKTDKLFADIGPLKKSLLRLETV
jgi:DNA-binding response OmpR family regulator